MQNAKILIPAGINAYEINNTYINHTHTHACRDKMQKK